MLRALWFFIQVGLIVAAALWLLERPGDVVLEWENYKITVQAGILALGSVLALLIFIQLVRIFGFLFSIPGMMSARQKEKNRQKGMKALTLGLAAISAGDSKTAARLSVTAMKYLPAQALPVLLSAQSASLSGNRAAAQDLYEQLSEDSDAAFFGLRGLIQSALERGEVEDALTHARAAMKKHPRQSWVLTLVYALELRARNWNQAQAVLDKIARAGALETDKVQSDRIAFMLLDAKDENLKLLKKAYALDSMSLPAAIALARHYADQNKDKKAAEIIQHIWPHTPHPDLLSIWEDIAPENKPSDMMRRLRWFEKLVALDPDCALAQMAAARAAMQDGFWNEAKAYAAMAETLQPSAALYRLKAEIERATSHDEEMVAHWMDLAADAPPSKVWTCAQTGTVYEHWSPVAEPHGSFNTIIWEYPARAVQAHVGATALPDRLGFFPDMKSQKAA